MKYFTLFTFLYPLIVVNAQQCGNCNTTPKISLFDLAVQVPKPAGNGEALLQWKQLFWLAKHANAYLFQSSKNCIRFMEALSYAEETQSNIIKIGETYTNLPTDKNISSSIGYFTTGHVAQSGSGGTMHMELQSACNHKTVAAVDVPFQLSTDPAYIMSIAQQAANGLSPLAEKIKSFELKERTENKKFAITGGDIDRIKISPQKDPLTAGQQTEITLELKDCDGIALAGREILFNQSSLGAIKINGTIGGTVTPAKVITDAQGKAKATFKMTAGPGQPAIIHAHTFTQTPANCEGVLIGSVKIDALPAYQVTVNYFKTGSEAIEMNSNDDKVSLSAGDKKDWEVASSYSILYYPSKSFKEGEQIMIMPQFENNTEIQKRGKTVVLNNDGYSEFNILSKPLALTASPVGAPPEQPLFTKQRGFSSTPSLPSVSFILQNNELIFFSGSVTFPAKDEGPEPLPADVGIEKGNTEFFPVKGEKITDAHSPFKWKYVLDYKKNESADNAETVLKNSSKEAVRATITILSAN